MTPQQISERAQAATDGLSFPDMIALADAILLRVQCHPEAEPGWKGLRHDLQAFATGAEMSGLTETAIPWTAQEFLLTAEQRAIVHQHEQTKHTGKAGNPTQTIGGPPHA